MVIKNKSFREERYFTGRMSDGSDRREVIVPIYEVIVSDSGKDLKMVFDHDPSEVEISGKIGLGEYEDVSPKPSLEDKVNFLFYKAKGVI